jgi:two-component system nitrate/nitrite sensor histidine kinase NarQ
MSYLELRTSDDWQLFEGSEQEALKMQNLPVLMQDTLYGELRWQSETDGAGSADEKRGHDARGLYFNQAQKHYQQLLLMEERATIARELHDSLAQVLSYLRIQLRRCCTLCRKKTRRKPLFLTFPASLTMRGINAELLTTFRLTLNHANCRGHYRIAG